MKLLSISESSKPEKKMSAVFLNEETGRKKTVHFGQASADDYTITKDKDQRQRYLDRHSKNENWNDPTSAGALSKWILWGESTSRQKNITQYKKHFNL